MFGWALIRSHSHLRSPASIKFFTELQPPKYINPGYYPLLSCDERDLTLRVTVQIIPHASLEAHGRLRWHIL